jgi:hypothetical protein
MVVLDNLELVNDAAWLFKNKNKNTFRVSRLK